MAIRGEMMVLELGGELPGPPEPRRSHRSAATGQQRAGRVLLYERVAQFVEQIIADRDLRPGDLLPSYAELAEQAGVSLITVRRALDELERAGRVRRHQGLGTFVARQPSPPDPARADSLLGILATSAWPAARCRSRIVSLQQGHPSEQLCHALGVSEDSLVWQFRRVWRYDDEPAVLGSAVIPVALAAGLDRLVDRYDAPLHELLATEYGLVEQYAEYCLQLATPTGEEVELLGLPARSPAIRVRGLSADAAGVPFGCYQQLFPASRFAFALAGRAVRRLVPVPTRWDWEIAPLS
ncbi:MAG: GntR family transcriptional regulator [Streptosporangiaceae bacterium]